MRKISRFVLPVAIIAAACSWQVSAADMVITASRVATAPKLAAGAADPVWAKVKALTVDLAGGENFAGGKGATRATLKSVYSGDMLYMLMQYADPTQSMRRSPFVKQADGSWKKLSDPDDKGGSYYIRAADKVAFDDGKFKPGDEVASIVVAPFTGDRGDIATAIKWAGGRWTAVMSRKLVTAGKFDVQFDNLDGTYEFGVATFDNAQVRHAFHAGVIKLKFTK